MTEDKTKSYANCKKQSETNEEAERDHTMIWPAPDLETNGQCPQVSAEVCHYARPPKGSMNRK